MNKRLQSTPSRQTFADFADKLAAKWQLFTTPNKPLQPTAGSAANSLEGLLSQLVAMPTVTGNRHINHDALDYIDQFLRKRFMHIKRFEWGGVEALVATTRPHTKKPKVMLAAHLDVVPGDKELFELREKNGKLYGRGALDMKFAIAAYMQIIDDLRHQLNNYDFGIMITTDEEAGGADGVARLIEEGYRAEVCILPDGGDNWQMQLYSKGFLYLTVSTAGKPAHGSRPWAGHNAIQTLVETVQDIYKLFPHQGPNTNTINMGKISGGQTINQVADAAEVAIDIRVTSEAEKTKLLRSIERICKEHNADLSVTLDGATTDFSLKEPHLAAFANLITEVTGIQVQGSRTLGSNDARYFVPHNIPCISLYPTGGDHHGPNEWIDKQSLHQFKEVLSRYLTATATRPNR
ncbi:MAG TPA: M20/M25/M40 family metallo-hydrolase [Nevskiaceae bacterium]|nr:M20/M25/M40 family metallo-hydrolase [Nevskiaceae bacterium]